MDSENVVRKQFERLNFIVECSPKISPINNQIRICEIKNKLNFSNNLDSKTIAFLEEELEEQTIGIPVKINAFKSYSSFGELKWISNKRPYIAGNYDLRKQVFNLSFTARFPEKTESLKKICILLV